MDTAYLEIDDLLLAAERILGHPPEIRDRGLLESALHRPQSTWFGEDVYPDLDQKAAALLLSLVGNHSLVDGNKRLGWVGVRVFYILNGHDLHAARAEARELILTIAAGNVTDVEKVAETLHLWRT
jgi:death-on-curing protein